MFRFARVAEQGIDFGRAKIAGIDGDNLITAGWIDADLVDSAALPLDVHVEGFRTKLDELAYRILFARRNDEIIRFVLLQDEPHGLYVVARMAPVTQGIKIADVQFVL